MKFNLGNTVTYIQRVLKKHVGSGGDAHLPVDLEFAGFMTPEMLTELGAASNEYIRKNTENVFDLPAGNFEVVGTPTNNCPVSSGWHHLKIIGNEGRKVIIAQHSYTGRMYTYNVHTDAVTAESPIGWRRLYQSKILYTGKTEDVGQLIVLNDSYKLFDHFEIFYMYLGVAHSQKATVNTVTDGFSVTALNLTDDMTNAGFAYAEFKLKAHTDKSLIVVRNKSCYSHQDGNPGFINDDKIDVFRIIGYF